MNFCFVCETWWDNEACAWKEKIHGIHVFFATAFAHSILYAPEQRIPVNPWHVGVSEIQSEYRELYLRSTSRSLTSPRGRAFYSNQNLLWMQKEGNDIFRDMNDQETLSHPFIANHSCWKWRQRSKMKEQHIITFPLSLC